MELKPIASIFPGKLWQLVNNCDIEAIAWNEAGDGIVVKTNLIEKDFLSLNSFKSSGFSSFARQLNSYGFRKTRPFTKDSIHHYVNPNFRRGRPELLPLLRRCHPKSKQNVKSDLEKGDVEERWRERRDLSPDEDPAPPSSRDEENISVADSSSEVEVPEPTPLHDLQPGDWIMARNLSSRPGKKGRWAGPHQVLQTSPTSVMIAEGAAWLHATCFKRISEWSTSRTLELCGHKGSSLLED